MFYKQFKKAGSSCVDMHIKDPLVEIYDRFSECKKCSLCTDREGAPVHGYGTQRPLLAVIGDKPSNYELEVGRPFVDQRNKKLRGMLEYVSRSVDIRNNVYYTNLIMCPSPTLDDGVVEACRERFVEEIRVVNPRVILVLGAHVARVLYPDKFETLSDIRGKVRLINIDKYYSAVITHSIDEIFYKNDEVRKSVKEDLDLLIREIKNEL